MDDILVLALCLFGVLYAMAFAKLATDAAKLATDAAKDLKYIRRMLAKYLVLIADGKRDVKVGMGEAE